MSKPNYFERILEETNAKFSLIHDVFFKKGFNLNLFQHLDTQNEIIQRMLYLKNQQNRLRAEAEAETEWQAVK